jgi:hypothetical protein
MRQGPLQIFRALINAGPWGEDPISRIPPAGHPLMATSKIKIKFQLKRFQFCSHLATGSQNLSFAIMKISLPLLAVMLLGACVLTGCQSPAARPPSGNSAAPSTRNNCCSLLHQLLDEQKDVSMLRYIKREHSDVKDLIKKIAAASGAGSKLLEEFAKRDPSLNLDDIRLPPGEVSTREAIASTKKGELLSRTGDEFELTLLLTQTEALSYAWHLAKVAGETEPEPERARALAGLSRDMQNFYNEVFVLLLSKTNSSAANLIGTRAD